MLGSYSNGGLGMGIAFKLEDHFTKNATNINKSMDTLSKNADAIARRIDRSMAMIKTGMAMGAVGALIVAPFAKGVKASSDYEENVNKLNVAFGAYADRVKKFTDNQALTDFGIGKNEASEMASLFGDMATGMGISQGKAADMSISLVKLAGDLKSFKNLEGDRAQNVLKGIFTGETESLKGIGVVMTQNTLDAYLMSQGINKAFKDLSSQEQIMTRMNYVMNATRNSAGDYKNTAGGYANATRAMAEKANNLSIALGDTLRPILAIIAVKIGNIVDSMRKFAESPAGKAILKLVLAFGVFLIVGGLVLILVGGLRIGMIKMANSFTGATKETILQSIAQDKLRASMLMMARATWISLAPILIWGVVILAAVLILKKLIEMLTGTSSSLRKFATVVFLLMGPIGWLILVIAKMVQGFRLFSNSSDEMLAKFKGGGGLVGFFVRLAGYVKAAMEIWRSWNGETFTISEGLKTKLEALGIWDSVKNMGTWLVRVKELMKGVWTGIKEGFTAVWGVVKSVFTSIHDAIVPSTKALDSMGTSFKKNTSDINKWATVGKRIGYVIVAVIGLITLAMLGMAISMLASMIVPILVITAIVLIVWGLYKAFMWVGAVISDFWNALVSGGVHAMIFLKELFVWFFTLPIQFVQWGADFVTYIWEGIKSVWTNMTKWISDAWDSVKEFFGFGGEESSVEKKLSKKVSHTIDGAVKAGGSEGTVKSGVTLDKANTHKNTSKSPKVYVLDKESKKTSAEQKQPLVIQNIMDGKVISEHITNIQDFNKTRK